MANYKKCPQGHMYDADQHSACPICLPAPRKTKILSALPWIVTAAALIAVVIMFNNVSTVRQELDDVTQQADEATSRAAKAEKERDAAQKKATDNTTRFKKYGYASENFYTNAPVLNLKAGGGGGTLEIYWKPEKRGGGLRLERSSKNFKAYFPEENINGDWIKVKVEPGSTPGDYTITFKNDINSETFDVLVQVR